MCYHLLWQEQVFLQKVVLTKLTTRSVSWTNTQISLFTSLKQPANTSQAHEDVEVLTLLVRPSTFCPTSQNGHSCLSYETKRFPAKS